MTAPISQVASKIDDTLRSHLELSSNSGEIGPIGSSLLYLLQELVGLSEKAAEDLLTCLVDANSDDDLGQPPYDTNSTYSIREIGGSETWSTWDQFTRRLKHGERFFGKAAYALQQIFGEFNGTWATQLPTYHLKVSAKRRPRIFRARCAESKEKVNEIVSSAADELTAAPLTAAKAGRMSPRGISTFYGALSSGVAVAEIRPTVGQFVVTGEFVPSRDLRLLDLTRIGAVRGSGNIFASDYFEQQSRAAFLRDFHSVLTKPVQDNDEEMDYLPTQAVSEYVKNILRFDGILFASTQSGRLETDVWDGFRRRRDTPLRDCNLAVFGREPDLNDFSFNSDDRPKFDRLDFPLSLVPGSVRIASVTGVEYRSKEERLADFGVRNPDF